MIIYFKKVHKKVIIEYNKKIEEIEKKFVKDNSNTNTSINGDNHSSNNS